MLGAIAERLRARPAARYSDLPTGPADRAAGFARPARCVGRSRAAAFPRRLSQSGDGDSGHCAAGRRRAAGRRDTAPGARRSRRRWSLRLPAGVGLLGVGVPRLRRPAQHGRLAQLVAEYPERPTAAGAAGLHRAGDRRACRARDARGRNDERAVPGYDVLAKRHSPSWNEKTRRVDRRAAGPAARAAVPNTG